MDRADKVHTLPSDFSVLSSMTELRALTLSLCVKPKFVAGDPLPVQFRFLRSATAVEELDLSFWTPSWSLGDASRRTMREAVRALLRLRQVSLSVFNGTLA